MRIGPAVDAIEAAERVQQRALPDARRADNRHHLAALDGEVAGRAARECCVHCTRHSTYERLRSDRLERLTTGEGILSVGLEAALLEPQRLHRIEPSTPGATDRSSRRSR